MRDELEGARSGLRESKNGHESEVSTMKAAIATLEREKAAFSEQVQRVEQARCMQVEQLQTAIGKLKVHNA